MIKINYEIYVCDFMRKYDNTRMFASLEDLADWIFKQMKQPYKNDPMAVCFPADKEKSSKNTLSPIEAGEQFRIHLIEDTSGGIIFSDGVMTGGQEYISEKVFAWCKECTKRRDTAKFNFVA